MSISYIVFSVVLTAVIVSDAYAYIDPATGSAIMSLIVGLFVGAGVIINNILVQNHFIFRFI